MIEKVTDADDNSFGPWVSLWINLYYNVLCGKVKIYMILLFVFIRKQTRVSATGVRS
jgi:hypothetical protein